MDRHGLLLIDKPAEMTSHDVVAKLRRALRQKRIGHTGTLDPIATGLMVVVLGEGTKLSDYLVAEDKAYLVDIRLGVTTDTLDRAGRETARREVNVTAEQISAAVAALTGEFEWPVPKFSAVKVDGEALHKRARRENEDFATPMKIMKFWDVKLVEQSGDALKVSLSCSKGSYIRTWVQQLGERLGTGAIVEELRRTRVGGWGVQSSISPSVLEDNEFSGREAAFISMGEALPGYRTLVADAREARLLDNGQVPKDLMGRLIPEQKQAFETGKPIYIKVVTQTGDLLAILAAEPGQGLKIRRVFRLS